MSTSRRSFLQRLGGAAAMFGLGGCASQSVGLGESASSTQPADRGDDFTFVHLTDAHVTARRKGDLGYRACVAHVNALRDRPSFALMGGDGPFDGLYTDRAIFERDTELYRSITAELPCPAHHCIGNHDVLGWSSRRKVPVDDPELGKTFLMKRLGMEKSYYSFDHGNWHFAVLDCIYPVQASDGTPSYVPQIGEEQLHWLARDLGRAGDRPKVVMTHIAASFLTAAANGDKEAKAINPSMTLRDSVDLQRLLERHKVAALLQGHSHTAECFEYRGVKYLTSPAVSAGWWGGTWTGSPPSYTQFRCRGDQLTWTYRPFGWQIQRDPEDKVEEEKQAKYDAEVAKQAALLAEERA